MLEQFSQNLKESGTNPVTIKCYCTDIQLFSDFCNTLNIDPMTADGSVIQKYLHQINHKPATMHRKTAAIRKYFKWGHETGTRIQPPFIYKDITLPEVPPTPITVISQENLDKIKDSIVSTCPMIEARDQLMFAMITRFRMKAGELLHINVSDIDLNTCIFHSIDYKGKRKINEKGEPKFTHLGELKPDLQKYLVLKAKYEREILKKEMPCPKLFINKHGKPISSRSLRRKLTTYGNLVGVSNFNPRTIRSMELESTPKETCADVMNIAVCSG